MTARSRITVLAALVASGGLLSAAARSLQPAGILQIVISGELNGHITPCGCSKPMLGGLPRRATYLATKLAGQTLVRIENGDITEASGRQDELKAETIAETLNLLKYDAVALGEKDFQLGLPYIASLQARFQGAFLCANVQLPANAPPIKPYIVVRCEVAARPVRVGIVGVLSDQYQQLVQAVNPDVKLEPPSAAIERLQPELAAGSDVRILLYHGPKAEAEEIAQRFKDFQLVIYGHEGDHPAELSRVDRSALSGSGQDGKYLSIARLDEEKGWQVESLRTDPLGPELINDPGVMQLKSVYLQRIVSEDLLGKVPRQPLPNGDSFAGSASCTPCHQSAHKVWTTSLHARALKTLEEEKHDKDPECAPCHVVGLNRISGFVTRERTPTLANVGCENCHGPAARHVKDPIIKLGKAGIASCQTCHVPQHDPHFDFQKYWPLIQHGR